MIQYKMLEFAFFGKKRQIKVNGIFMRTLNQKLLTSKIEEMAREELEENKFFGCSYAVCLNGKVIFKRCFGDFSPDGGRKLRDNDVFRIASMTKPITTFAILMLIDRGLVSLDDRVSKYIPEFEHIHVVPIDGEDMGVTKTPVTVKHLLTHTSGFGSFKYADRMSREDKESIDSTVKYFIRAGLDFEPFTQTAYGAFAAFDVLAAILERVTGEDYAEFLSREIFAPCGMTDTVFEPSAAQIERLVPMHGRVDGKSVTIPMPDGCFYEKFPYAHKLAGAGLVSTLNDYSAFAEMLLNEGVVKDKRLVSKESFSLYAKPYVPKDMMPWEENWGMGVRVITNEEFTKTLPVGSFGWSGAYGTHFWVDPVNNITAVFMKNSAYDGGAGNASALRFESAVYSSFD